MFHAEDPTGEQHVFEDVQEVSDVLAANKERYKYFDERSRWGDGDHVASIPLVVWEDLQRQGIANDKKRFAAWLNDPDNRAFRTRPGRI